MNYKKMLFTICVVVLVVLGFMIFTSYAWYTFSGGSTSFNTNTYNEYIDIEYSTSEIINVSNAIPIDDEEVDSNASSNNFSVNVVGASNIAEVLLSISLVDITISQPLINVDFKYQLLHNGEVVKEGTGLDFLLNKSSLTSDDPDPYIVEKMELVTKEVIYSNAVNEFVFRVWIRDNGLDQTSMEGKTFSASIDVNAVKVRNG